MAEVQCTVDSIRVAEALPDALTLILRKRQADDFVPIIISKLQGQILADELHGRPDSSTELEAFLSRSNCTESDIGSATIHLEGSSFIAKVLLSPDRRPHEVRCPIGIALALAVRAGAPIFVDQRVFENAGACLSAERC